MSLFTEVVGQRLTVTAVIKIMSGATPIEVSGRLAVIDESGNTVAVRDIRADVRSVPSQVTRSFTFYLQPGTYTITADVTLSNRFGKDVLRAEKSVEIEPSVSTPRVVIKAVGPDGRELHIKACVAWKWSMEKDKPAAEKCCETPCSIEVPVDRLLWAALIVPQTVDGLAYAGNSLDYPVNLVKDGKVYISCKVEPGKVTDITIRYEESKAVWQYVGNGCALKIYELAYVDASPCVVGGQCLKAIVLDYEYEGQLSAALGIFDKYGGGYGSINLEKGRHRVVWWKLFDHEDLEETGFKLFLSLILCSAPMMCAVVANIDLDKYRKDIDPVELLENKEYKQVGDVPSPEVLEAKEPRIDLAEVLILPQEKSRMRVRAVVPPWYPTGAVEPAIRIVADGIELKSMNSGSLKPVEIEKDIDYRDAMRVERVCINVLQFGGVKSFCSPVERRYELGPVPEWLNAIKWAGPGGSLLLIREFRVDYCTDVGGYRITIDYFWRPSPDAWLARVVDAMGDYVDPNKPTNLLPGHHTDVWYTSTPKISYDVSPPFRVVVIYREGGQVKRAIVIERRKPESELECFGPPSW